LAEVSLWGLSLGIFGVVVDENPNARGVAAFGAAFSALGMIASISDLYEVHGLIG